MAFSLPMLIGARVSRIIVARRTWSLVSRALAALAGGYAFTTLLTLALALSLPALGVSRVQLLQALSMASFLVYAVVIMAVFHASSAARAWLWLGLGSLPLGIVVALGLSGAS